MPLPTLRLTPRDVRRTARGESGGKPFLSAGLAPVALAPVSLVHCHCALNRSRPQQHCLSILRLQRSIPAWAGSTCEPFRQGHKQAVHPRVGGEHNTGSRTAARIAGSSPCGRGTQFRLERRAQQLGEKSAHPAQASGRRDLRREYECASRLHQRRQRLRLSHQAVPVRQTRGPLFP